MSDGSGSDSGEVTKPLFNELEKRYNTSTTDINTSFYKHNRNSSVYSLIEPPSARDRSSLQSVGRNSSIVDHDDPVLLPLQVKAASQIHIMDFGLSEYYRDMKTNVHKPRSLRFPCGTPRFMSRNTHMCERKCFYFLFFLILFFFFFFFFFLIIFFFFFFFFFNNFLYYNFIYITLYILNKLFQY